MASDQACFTPAKGNTLFLSPRLHRPSSHKTLYETAHLCQSHNFPFVDLTPNASHTHEVCTNANDTTTNQQQKSKTAFETCLDYSFERIKQAKERLCEQVRRSPLNNLLAKLSIVSGDSVSIAGDKESLSKCGSRSHNLKANEKAAKKRINMMTSTPIMKDVGFNSDFFKVIHVQKTELHDLAPRVPEYHAASDSPARERCINNNNIQTPNGNHYNQRPAIYIENSSQVVTPKRQKGHNGLNPMQMPLYDDNNVLKKVSNLEQLHHGGGYSTTPVGKTTRIYVPEKLHFSAYDRFEGQVFVNWLCGSLTESAHFNETDLAGVERLIALVSTHLIAAGVLKQIVDNVEKVDDVFCPYRMYRWARNEEFRNHAKYTEEPKKLEEHIQNGYKNIIDDANTNNNCNENNAEVDSERSNNERISKDSGLSNGIDSTDSSSNSRKSIFMDQIDCDNNDKVDIIRCEEKSTQTDLLDLNGSEISSIPPTRIPIAPPFPEHFLVPASSSTPIKSDRNTKAVHAFNATPPAPPPPPPPPPAPLVKTTSRTILSSASSFCAPDQNKSIPGPPPMPCPPPMPQITGSGKDTLRKKAKNPPEPMIHLYWKRIIVPETEQKTYWANIDETQLNMDDFTEHFARQVISKQTKESASKPPKKPKFIKVLDNKRSQSVGIFSQSLHRSRIDSKLIEYAIYNWNTTSVGLDLLQQMLEQRATDKELVLIKEAQAAQPDLPLDGPELFLLRLSEISCAAERIECLIFSMDFDECSQQITQKIATVQVLCEFLIKSNPLKELFSIILTLGNYMNGGNRFRGQADGFGLDVLNKLNDVKSKDKKSTLLHYIVKTYINKRLQKGDKLTELEYPIPEAQSVRTACSIDLIALNEQITSLQKTLSDYQTKMRVVVDASTAVNLEPFNTKSHEFVRFALLKIDIHLNSLMACKKIFHETLVYFKHIPKTEQPDECTPNQFFELWLKFVGDFGVLWKREIDSTNAILVLKHRPVSKPIPKQDQTLNVKQNRGLRERPINQIQYLQ